MITRGVGELCGGEVGSAGACVVAVGDATGGTVTIGKVLVAGGEVRVGRTKTVGVGSGVAGGNVQAKRKFNSNRNKKKRAGIFFILSLLLKQHPPYQYTFFRRKVN